MKHFKDIREGLLKGQSNTLVDGESAAEVALKEQMMQYFLKDGDIPRNKKNGFIRFFSDDDCDFEKINKNKFPNCQLWFSKTVLVQTFLNTIGKSTAKYELGYLAPNIFIK